MINTKAYLRALALGLAVNASTVGKLQAQTTIPATHVLPSSAGDTNKPGFIWRFSQVASGEPNQLAWAEDQLAGLHGDNLADPTAAGVAVGPANPPNPSTAPITFEIPGFINLSKSDTITQRGNFRSPDYPDQQMPGLPGTTGGTDSSAAELLTYLDLPAGTITMGVNSDDGFRMTIGGAIPTDRFGANVGQFDGGRGAGNSIFTVKVTQAGLYATRVLWENGGGDANIEVFTVGADGVTPILFNDTAKGGIKAYRGVTAVAPAYAKKVVPAPGDVNVLALAPIHVDLVDGGTPIDKGTVSLQVDGSSVSATINKPTDTTSVDYQISNLTPFSSGPHTAALIYTEGATKITNNWSFAVGKYVTLDPAWRVTAVDTSKPGFVWNYFANSDASNTGNSIARAEADLAFPVDATGAPLANLANHAVVGVAVGAAAPPSPANAPVHFEIAGVINLSIGGSADNNGNFTPDLQMPGVPSTDGTTDGQAAEIITYLTLPVGAITMGVNSDDNFSTAAGPNPKDAFGRVTLGSYDQSGGRGASDSLFVFNVQQAGTYAFRTVWENGAGGSNIELFTVKPGGVKVLVNDLARGGIPAFRAVTTAPVPYVKAVTPSTLLLPRQVLNFGSTMSLLLADGANAVADSSVSLKINGKDIPLAKTRQGSFLNVTADVSKDLHIAGDSAVLTFEDSTGAYSRSQTWTLYNLVNLVFPAAPVTGENFDSYQESTGPADTVPPGWVASNFTYHETPGWDLGALDSDAYLDWVIITADRAAGLETTSNDTTQIINGQPITDWVSGNVLFSASDSRAGGGLPQVRQVITKPFDLSSVTNPVLSFYSILRISGNRTEGMFLEYSIDGGRNWLPAAYYQRDGVTLVLDLDGSYDAVPSFNTPGSIVTRWIDPVLGPRGGRLGDYLAAPLSAALSPYIVERRDSASSRRVEAVRLPQASKQKDVRIRFAHVGSCGWYWGLDNIAFYDIGPAPGGAQPRIDRIAISSGQVTVQWTNGGTLESSPGLTTPAWTTTGNSSGTFTESVAATGNKFYRVKQ